MLLRGNGIRVCTYANKKFQLVLLIACCVGFFSGSAPAIDSPVGNKIDSASAQGGPLTIDQRVAYQRAIEEVYWRHRIWPKENKQNKPSLQEMVPDSVIAKKVEDHLRKSDALDSYWHRPITAEQLQAEMNRMARETKQPAVLNELFAALDHDPYLIAECLARPNLADRFIRNLFSYDERFHGDLKRRVQSELQITNTIESMRALSGEYHETVWKKGNTETEQEPLANSPGSILLDSTEWNEWITRLQGLFQSTDASLPLKYLSSLKEDADRFYITAILELDDSHIKTAVVEWKKQPFEEWWREAKPEPRAEIPAPVAAYHLPSVAPSIPCEDTWTPTYFGIEARNMHTAIWTGSEMIIWGGYNGGFFNTGWRYDPSTDTWTPTSKTNVPWARFGHTAIWTGSEMIVWGGFGNLNTGGRYDPDTDTWMPTSTANAPEGRDGHTAVWTGFEMIVWGGFKIGSGSIYFNTGGRYDPTNDTWTPTNTANAPNGRHRHTAVWTGSEMIVWGGYYTGNYLSTGGRYDPSNDNWIPTSTSNPPQARYYHTAVWTGTKMIIWGGLSGASYFGTGGQYDPSTDTWMPTNTTNAPAARRTHTALWTGTEMIVWGGWNNTITLNSGGRYEPSSDSWIPTDIANAPGARQQHTAVWTGSEMIIWGGYSGGYSYDGGSYLNTGGRYDPSTNTWITASTLDSPEGRTGHTAVWTGSEMIIWGGVNGEHGLKTGGRYEPATNTWTPTSTINAPEPHLHTAVWTGSEMIVWGGYQGSKTASRYNPSTDTWTPINTANAPEERYNHTAVWTGTEMIVWGGYNYGILDTGGRYNPLVDNWAPTSTTDAPQARATHTAVWTGSEMIVWGGNAGGNSTLNTGGRYNPVTDTWTPTDTANAPEPRSVHTAVWTGSEMIVWAGFSGGITMNSGGRYNPFTDTWTPIDSANAPDARYHHTAVWTGSEMIVWGGRPDYSSYLNTGGRYYPTTDAWTTTNIATAPEARYDHTAIWTGSEMILWGGYALRSYLNTGSLYCANTTVAGNDHYTTEKNVTLVVAAPGVLANDTDLQGDPLTAVLDAGPANGSLALNADGSFTYTPNPGFDGVDTFTYHANDAIHDSNIATVTITIINSEPVAADDDYSAHKNLPLTIAAPGVLANDVDSDADPITAVADSTTSNGTLTLNSDGSFTYVPNMGFDGTDHFTYHANDGTDSNYLATVSITVTNDAPAADDDSYSASKNIPLNIAAPGLLANDTDLNADFLTAILDSTTSNGSLTLNSDGSFTYIPNTGFDGIDSFTYHASDGTDASNVATVTITVINSAPVAADDNYSTNKNVPLHVAAPGVLVNDADPDSDTLTSVLDSTTSNGTLTLNFDGSFSYTPNSGFEGMDSFTYHASDGSSGSNIATVTIVIIGSAPTAADDNYSTDKNTPLNIAAPGVLSNDTDPDNDALSVVLDSTTSNGTLALNADGSFTYTPNTGFVGSDTFSYHVNDGTAGSNIATVSITVNQTCLFCDDFNDDTVDPNWTYIKPSWSESGGALIGTPSAKKAIAVAAPVFAGCQVCTVEARLQTAGGSMNKLLLLSWYVDKANTLELLIKQQSNKWILKQRAGGSVVTRAKAFKRIDPNTPYVARIVYDGTTYKVFIDDFVTPLMTLNPQAPVPVGTIGFQVKNTVGMFDYITVN